MKWFSLTRYSLVGGLLTLFSLLIVGRIGVIQTGAFATNLNEWVEVRSYEKRTVYPERGKIYDRWGNLLAGNKVVYELGLELKDVTNPQAIALTLTSLDKALDFNFVFTAANKEYDPNTAIYVPLNNYVSEDVIEKIESVKKEYSKNNPYGANPNLPSLDGVVWSPRLVRVYPEQNLASNVLGFYSFRDLGNEAGHQGIEGFYNNQLTGRPV
ncbi:MAG: hypothetical protein HGA53_10395, partial [Anaerolineaceae bacterium]|nr:hypothetical protein [Anaerolineaceae bacterium]